MLQLFDLSLPTRTSLYLLCSLLVVEVEVEVVVMVVIEARVSVLSLLDGKA